MKVSPSIALFRHLRVGEREGRRVTIASIGTLTLDLSTIASSGDSFSLTSGTPPRIAVKPGESFDIDVEYQSPEAGYHSTSLWLETNYTSERSRKIRFTDQTLQ